jgi:predicted AlkP superfamily phosphohydrolase/phosphomutase
MMHQTFPALFSQSSSVYTTAQRKRSLSVRHQLFDRDHFLRALPRQKDECGEAPSWEGPDYMLSNGKVLAIGLDGATFTILQPLMEQGKMPHLAQMQREGSWGSLLSTVPPVTAPAWSSFMTGVNPGKHGVFDFFQRDPRGYAYEETAAFVHAGSVLQPALWDILSQANKRVGVVNIPLTYPPHRVNGFMITGMLTPPSARTFTYPPELSGHLEGYRIDLEHTRTDSGFDLERRPDEDTLLQAVNELLDCRAEHCLRLMGSDEWDFFMVVFVGPDRLFHELWHYLDPNCMAYNSARGKAVRRAVESYLNRLDAVVGRLRGTAGPDATTFVMSDHGFGPAPEKRVNLNEWLVDLDLLRVARGGRHLLKAEYWATRLGLRRPASKRILEKLVPLHRLRRAGADRQGRRAVPADWHRTRAHAMQMYNHYCGIEINLKGRKRQGIVNQGQEYEQLRDHILSELSKLRDPEDGFPLVQSAYRREAIFAGAHSDLAPDIVVELDPRYAGVASLGNGRIVTAHDPRRQGDHRREGIFLAQGPIIVPGSISPSAFITDLAPTILYALGVPVYQDMDGSVLTEIFDRDYVASHPVSFTEVTLPDIMAETENPFSAEDRAAISDRLRRLGYLG